MSLSPLQYATITGHFVAETGDTTNDGDYEPDAVPLTGTVTFTPSVDSVLVATATPPTTVLLQPIVAMINSSGDLVLDGANHPVLLQATDDPAINPQGFTWQVSFDLTLNTAKVSYKPFSFAAPKSVTTNLTVVTPVSASNGVAITRGPAGSGITLKGTKASFAALPATGNTQGDAWTVSADGHLYTWDSTSSAWVDAGPFVGPAGAQGPTGPTGPTGAQGATIRSGSGAPSNSLGANGDYYLNTANGDLYLRATGTYTLNMNLKGPAGTTGANGADGAAGPAGSTWRTGPGAPSNSLGNNGDLFLSTTTGTYYVKASGSYTSVGSLLGPAGPTGPAGSAGPTGATGPAGAAGATGPAGATGAQGPDGVNSFIAGPGAVRLWPASATFPTSGMVTGDLFPHIE